jgi:hypothetical protein
VERAGAVLMLLAALWSVVVGFDDAQEAAWGSFLDEA